MGGVVTVSSSTNRAWRPRRLGSSLIEFGNTPSVEFLVVSFARSMAGIPHQWHARVQEPMYLQGKTQLNKTES